MKRTRIIGLVVFTLALAVSCKREALELEIVEGNMAVAEEAAIEQRANPGKVIICASDELTAKLEAKTRKDGTVKGKDIPEMAASGVISMKRLFPEAGKFEPRTRAAGLHKWYVIEYDEGMTLTKAGSSIRSIPGVEEFEYDYKIEIVGNPQVVEGDVPPVMKASTYNAATALFDDPFLSNQWHYYNNGTLIGAVSGCDVNVVPVWRSYTTGNPDVVVAVVDGGVDFSHEDLSANMWNNPEKSGDMKYGYNFVNDTYQITPENHGTHVAGTIAAVNNNGKGVCGIAGGNSKARAKGVKIMSCQIFQGNKSGGGAQAIKWAADHGAVIAQNSWGYPEMAETPASVKAAVDYFRENAGVDEKGNQTGPMKGGVVLFAAGNENKNTSSASYGPIISVASVGADYRRAYYSDYGSWVDISAPGGDARKGSQIYSTLPGNRYGYMQGTSMACPHVSGVAALIVSKNGKKGYTAETLEKKLLGGVTNISTFNPNFAIGRGLVNAYMSIAGTGGKAPSKPTNLVLSSKSNTISFSVTVPSDPDDKVPTSIYVYYSPSNFSDKSNAMFGMFYVEGLDVGETLEGKIVGLDFNTEYYVACTACDLAGNHSNLTDRQRIKTGDNNPPILKLLNSKDVKIKAHESASVDYEIIEPDDHFYTIDLEPGSEAAVLDTTERSMPKVAITGANAPTGTYQAKLIVTDYYGLATTEQIEYTILENHKPQKVADMQNLIFNSRETDTQQIKVADYFTDEDGEELKYTFDISDINVVNMTYSKGSFFLTPMNYGYSDITITATDIRDEKVSQTFKVLVRDGNSEVDVYPNPVHTNLYVRTGSDAEAELMVVSASGAKVYDETKKISPFYPAVVDMSSCAAGTYAVILKINGKELKTNVVKL